MKTLIPKWERSTPLDPRRNAGCGIGRGITRRHHRTSKPVIAAIYGVAVGTFVHEASFAASQHGIRCRADSLL